MLLQNTMLSVSKLQLARLFAVILCFLTTVNAIQCYSGSQLQIIECPSVSCIKQSMGLDTVRYCDGSGASSICQTYGLMNMCSSLPNMGHVCCCSEQLCNGSTKINSSWVICSGIVFLLVRRFIPL
ncbi:hypothetical protein M3Y98_00197000 [Aphelenchoides besseyi]|nr:hypothetical protein M3Y98_00197000 [Aphelenchoides besseyi]